jgi:hypothetical protein
MNTVKSTTKAAITNEITKTIQLTSALIILKVVFIGSSVHLLFIRHRVLNVEFSGRSSNILFIIKTCLILLIDPVISCPTGFCPG